MRVEQALRLLPDLEALMPLRGLLLASARPDERIQWGSGGPYLTVGKRAVEPGELASRIDQVLAVVSAHVASLYRAYVEALERQEQGDSGSAVTALLSAGRLEERADRAPQAAAWYEVALALAEGLQDRRPEVETLLALGHVYLGTGQYPEGARHYQRALVLAEAEFDQAGAIDASAGLGSVALERGEWGGAQAWYARALRLVEAGGDRLRVGRIEHRLGLLVRRQGDLAAAGDHLRRARECFEELTASREMAEVLDAQGQLDAALGRPSAATAAYREALAWVRRGEERDAGLEVGVRLHLAELFLATGRLLEAEEEMRRAEQLAITSNLTRRLVQIYVLLGKLRGQQADETGFVFFEQAIELCRTLERSPVEEARVYHEYGLFRHRCGGPDEARAHLEHAREIFRSLGVETEVEQVQAEIETLTA
ncbi:MAG TPA: tetratricopeptide repeat protein [Gemmatimonadales bacterium]|nr:tetratricopeptide repeat protein [Gemmatimonadales bacterium]